MLRYYRTYIGGDEQLVLGNSVLTAAQPCPRKRLLVALPRSTTGREVPPLDSQRVPDLVLEAVLRPRGTNLRHANQIVRTQVAEHARQQLLARRSKANGVHAGGISGVCGLSSRVHGGGVI